MVSRYEPDYIRLGGRSSDPEIKKRTLFEVRKQQQLPGLAGGLLGPSVGTQKKQAKYLVDTLQPLNRDEAKKPFKAEDLKHLGVISGQQLTSLQNGCTEWIDAEEDAETGPLEKWLAKSLVPFDLKYEEETFGFEEEEEEDLEYEQLKELEAEHGIKDDEDYDALKGPYYGVATSVMGRRNPAAARKAKQNLQSPDLWTVPTEYRGEVYNMMLSQALVAILASFRSQAIAYAKTARDLKTGKWERDAVLLQTTRIIGLTTTGLSKYRALIASLKPKVILIEEAAEVIEAPVTVACVESLEHLILVGDHQQLQGHCAVQDLEGDPFYLNISMFERLVRNQVDFQRLSRQRRMAPEIRRLLAPIYTNLQDHPSVLDRPDVPGMGGLNSFFFCHSWPEESDHLLSKYNAGEAAMIKDFFVYLAYQGVPTAGITVLTFYNGQRKKILKALKNVPYLQGRYINVVTVDSYQGEENAIVLLSLVRSNSRTDERSIGFLSIENRVCVALSRAKLGFYLFGDAEQLSTASKLWFDVAKIMGKEPRRIGYALPLTCKSHGRKVFIREPKDWVGLDGGCDRKCSEALTCGHRCPLKCHPYPHTIVKCFEPCRKQLVCGHSCLEICSASPCCCECPEPPSIVGEIAVPALPGQLEHSGDSLGGYAAAVIRRIPSWETRNNEETTLKSSRSPSSNSGPSSIQAWKQYAAGGARDDDLRLARMEGHPSTSPQAQNTRLDKEAALILFGDEGIINEPSVSVSTSPAKSANSANSRMVPDGRGGNRLQFKEYFSGAVSSGSSVQEPSLLD